MAPDESKQKRRRGRPAGASKAPESATASTPDEEPTQEHAVAEEPAESIIPQKRRGRPRKSTDGALQDGDQPKQADAGQAGDSSAAPKKRGRPRKSTDSTGQDEAPPAPEESHQADEPSDAAPKKRGRPPKAHNPEPEEEDTSEARPRKRRRAGETDGAEAGQQESGRSKAGQPLANARLETSEAEERNATAPDSRRSKRAHHFENNHANDPVRGNDRQAETSKNKPERKPASQRQPPPEEGEPAQETSGRRKGRARRPADENEHPTAQDSVLETSHAAAEPPGATEKRRRGRPSLAELSISKAQNQAGPAEAHQQSQKKKRGRPSVSSTARNNGTSDEPAEAPSPKPQRPTTSKTHPTTTRRRHPPPERESRPPRSEPPAPLADLLPAHHPHLATRTRQIPRSTIAAKWTPLSTPSITAVDALLADAARPVLHRLRDRDARRAQAQTILRMFATRLRGKLVKGLPFPPPASGSASSSSSTTTTTTTNKGQGRKNARGKAGGGGGHEAELDFERTVAGIASLERALDPLLHGVALLQGEKEREERALRREYDALRVLEANARAQARGWREGRGREHVLVGGVGGSKVGREEEWERGEGVKGEFRAGGRGGGEVFKDLQNEEELLALSQQIGNHMESMRSNLAQLDGVLPAIAKSRAALQGALCEHLDPEQYEQVLLG